MGKVKQKGQKKKQISSKILYGFSLVFLALGLYQLAWAVWPVSMDGVQIAIPEGELAGAPPEVRYASPADYTLEVSWPRWLRVGQEGVVEFVLREASEEESAQASQAALVVLVEPAFTNLSITPPGRIQANLGPGQDLELTWHILGDDEGSTAGKIYAAFGFYDESAEEMVTVPVAVVDVDIHIISIWGMERNLAVWFGLIALGLWGALFVFGRYVQVKN